MTPFILYATATAFTCADAAVITPPPGVIWLE